MAKRLIFGLVIGLLVGALVAAAAIKGLAILTFAGAAGTAWAYILAAVTGAITGLVAGKPFWSADGKIEAGLKAFFGALLAAGGMFALHRWVTGAVVNLDALGAGSGALSDLPAAALPAIGGVLGAIFELDNTPSDSSDDGKGARPSRPGATAAGKASAKKNVRVAAQGNGDGNDEDVEAAAGKRARR